MIKEYDNGFEKHIFEYKRRRITVLLPKDKNPDNKWVWRAEFFGAFDYADRSLLNDGWYVIHYAVPDMYGCDEAIKLMKDFHDYIVKAYALSKKAAIFGFSRGGLYSVNYTIKHPSDIGCIYLDAPVLDIKSWPAGYGDGIGGEKEWEECKACYGLTEDTAKDFCNNPIDNANLLVATKIPLILVCGDSDDVVPYKENGERLAEIYKQNSDVKFKLIVKEGIGHHPHSLENPKEITDFIKENAL